jgi:DNA-binding response OmpR family regulator
MRVLIIEDEPLNAMCFEDALDAAGHAVTVIAGACKKDDGLVGFGNGGDLALDLTAFDFAVVDGNLIGDMKGWEIVPILVAAGITCIGISGDCNDKIVAAGAKAAFAKPFSLRLLPEAIENLSKAA